MYRGEPADTATPASTPVLATPVDPVTFFRSLQAACAAHAASTGNPAVEPDRFSGAAGDAEPVAQLVVGAAG